MSFKDKVVIVTGASSGIGAAAAVAFSAEGARVVMVGRKEAKLAAVAARCNDPLVLRADVAVDEDVRRIVDQTMQKFGQLDILVNNAGISVSASLLEGDIMKSYDFVSRVNLRAIIHLTSLATPHLIKTKGNVVNISSIVGKLTGMSSLMAYAVSKAGLNHFSDFAALELAPYGVRVNTVSPGPTKTDIIENSKAEYSWNMFKQANTVSSGPTKTDIIENSKAEYSWDMLKQVTALNRISEPEEIADLILFLASDKAKGITGSNFISDNGMAIKRL